MTKQERIQQLVDNYKKAEQKIKPHSTDPISCLNRDEMRRIKKVFEKEIHEPIDRYL